MLRRKILIRRDGHGALEPREPYTTLGNRGRIIRAPLEKHVTHWFPKRSWAVMGASSATGAAVDLRYTIGASWRRQSASAIPIYVSTHDFDCCHWLQGKSAKTERPNKLVGEGKAAKTEPLYAQPKLVDVDGGDALLVLATTPVFFDSRATPSRPACASTSVRDHTPVDESAQPQQSPRVLPSSRPGPSSQVVEPLSLTGG